MLEFASVTGTIKRFGGHYETVTCLNLETAKRTERSHVVEQIFARENLLSSAC